EEAPLGMVDARLVAGDVDAVHVEVGPVLEKRLLLEHALDERFDIVGEPVRSEIRRRVAVAHDYQIDPARAVAVVADRRERLGAGEGRGQQRGGDGGTAAGQRAQTAALAHGVSAPCPTGSRCRRDRERMTFRSSAACRCAAPEAWRALEW